MAKNQGQVLTLLLLYSLAALALVSFFSADFQYWNLWLLAGLSFASTYYALLIRRRFTAGTGILLLLPGFGFALATAACYFVLFYTK